MKRSGFLILEVLIYITLALMIVIPLLCTCSYLYNKVSREYERNFASGQLNALLTIFTREIQMAPRDYKEWKLISSEALVWHTSNGDRGWVCVKKRLISLKGRFNSSQNRWLSRHQGIQSGLIERVEFVPVITNRGKEKVVSVISVKIELQNSPIIFRRSIAPRSMKGGL